MPKSNAEPSTVLEGASEAPVTEQDVYEDRPYAQAISPEHKAFLEAEHPEQALQ